MSSIDMNWESARDDILEVMRNLKKHIESPVNDLPGNLDLIATVDEFEEAKKWEARLQELLSDLHTQKDDLFFTEHLRVEKDERHDETLRNAMLPVGFEQGVAS